MKRHWKLVIILCSALLGNVEASANGGEKHAGHEVPAVSMPGENFMAESAFSETFELVLKHLPLSPRKEETFKIFLTDFATNAPVEKATIEIEVKGPAQIKAAASETNIHGLYEIKLSFPQKGDYSLTFNIQAGDFADTLIVSKISVGAVETKSNWVGVVLRVLKRTLLFAFLFAVAIFGWRKRHILTGLFALTILFGLLASQALGNGGDSHGPEVPTSAAPAAAGAPIYLSKESQFLLAVRTTMVASQELKKRISTIGHVIPRSQGKADVVTLQAGRLIVDEHYKLPQIGDRMKKGEIVAEIEVIDSFHILAPISGVVTEVNYTAGEWMEQGKKLLTIIDLSIVWVEANIFENDLPAIEDSHHAFIKSQTYPNREFKGALITLGKVLDPETRSVKAVFEAANPDEKLRPGMFVDVAIETKASEETMAVPSSAVLDKDGQRVIFLKTGPETFTMRQVEIGGQYGELTSVKSGIVEGERVVIVGNYQLLTTPPMAAK